MATSKKDILIKAEIKRLTKIFENLPEKARDLAKEQINNAAFMSVSLRELQGLIVQKGYSDTYQNGENQQGTKKTPEVEIYNTMIKNFNTTMKQLYDLLPETAGPPTPTAISDPFMDFIAGNSKRGGTS